MMRNLLIKITKTFFFPLLLVCCSTNPDKPISENEEIVVKTLPLSKAYAKTMVNTPIFRVNSIVSDSNFQIVSYYDGDGNIIFAKRSLKSEKWDFFRTHLKGDVNNAHNIISMELDGEGFIHLSYNQHASPLCYRKSIHPYEFVFGEPEYMVDSIEEQEVTYPEFYRKSNGNIIFVYRSGYSGNGNLVMNEYDIKSKRWLRIHSNLISGEDKRNAYWQIWIDNQDNFFISWVWRETADVETNHDVCFAKSSDGLHWVTSEGVSYELPLNIRNSEIVWPISQKSNLINQTSMTVDRNGNSYIATYWSDSIESVPQYRILSNVGGAWHSIPITERTVNFSLAGIGTKRIPIARPRIVVDDCGRAFFIFRDIERREVVSLAYCNDISNPNWRIVNLTNYSVESWEPTIDMDRWKRENILDIYVQRSYQGDGETTVDVKEQDAYVIEVLWKK